VLAAIIARKRVYAIDDDGFCRPIPDEPVPSDLEAAARAGVEACPENALVTQEDD
jgi:ferredoxin